MYSNASFTFVVIFAATAAAANTEDAYFLFNFKASVKEDPTGAFKSWQLNSAARPCDWEGVQCDVSVLKGVPVVRGVSLPNRDILGTLWNDMGKLRFMRMFNLTGNRFQGKLMSYIGDALVLETLDLSNNNFTGVLPAFEKLVYLKSLVLYGNQFEGDFPGTACDGGAIRYMDMSNNNLRGFYVCLEFISSRSFTNISTISKEVYRCSKLETLKLSDNALHGDVPTELGELTRLRVLDLARNQLTGPLPEAIGGMKYLTHLLLNDNEFAGYITPSISAATYMQELDLSNNQIGKNVPDTLGNLVFLERLSLSKNKVQGSIPQGIGKMTSLVSFLDLSNNMLTGGIPAEIGNLQLLQKIDFSNNKISGSLPNTWGGCYSLGVLDLSGNRITGNIPVSMQGLASIQNLNLSHNGLGGEIFLGIGNLTTLSILDLSHNNLTGSVPESFGSLSSLTYFDGSYNKLTGSPPRSLENLTKIDVFDLSHNDLSGLLLDTSLFRRLATAGYLNNEKGLCGSVLNITCPSTPNIAADIGKEVIKFIKSKQQLLKYIPLVAGAMLGVGVLVLLILLLLLRILRPRLFEEAVECLDSTISLVLGCCGGKSRLSTHDLSAATDNFSNKNIIGYGNRYKVYHGKLPKREPFAIKVINPELFWEMRPHFLQDCKLLRRLHHQNVMQILDWSYKPHFLAMVFKYMPRGSLYDNLYSKTAMVPLSWDKRLEIAIDVAHGLVFLHHWKKKRLVYCQLCPSNILLDENCRAQIAGLHIMRQSEPNTAAGVLMKKDDGWSRPEDYVNYLAPECAPGAQTDEQADVYSYGLTILELITRKRSTTGMLSLNKSLQARMRNLFPHNVMQLVDTDIIRTTTNSNQIFALIEIALSCAEDDPVQRPDMRSVVSMLTKVKNGDVEDYSQRSQKKRFKDQAETPQAIRAVQQNDYPQYSVDLFSNQFSTIKGIPFSWVLTAPFSPALMLHP